ncbi:MAG: GNAT family N-acetyltransferase [Bacteroidetes bacterium]|nr:GNAT family N-acetyltransferase [Bacteroidota bacterium]
MKIRLIQKNDNAAIASVIKRSLEEFGVARAGTVYTDESTNSLFELFNEAQLPYNILIDDNNKVVGGCGLYKTEGLPQGYVEVVKLYIAPEARGKGYGEQLLYLCFEQAKDAGFTHVYLETLHELSFAVKLYEKVGLDQLKGALGSSGHFACSLWMEKKL